MLTWTSAGAVARPRALQVRIQTAWPNRVPAGAPAPGRAMSTDEVLANLAWFTTTSPRSLPVQALVFAGQGTAAREDLPELVTFARTRGVSRITLHAGANDLRRIVGIDRYAVPVRSLSDAGAIADAGLPIDVTLALSADNLAGLAEIAAAVAPFAGSLTFTYPFPDVATSVPTVADAVAAIGGAVAGLPAALPRSVKGLPACWLGPLHRLVRKSSNRWYVDAEHQKDKALLFFPEVVAFAKDDPCRFCGADAICDGFLPARRRADDPALRPVDP